MRLTEVTGQTVPQLVAELFSPAINLRARRIAAQAARKKAAAERVEQPTENPVGAVQEPCQPRSGPVMQPPGMVNSLALGGIAAAG